MISAVIALFGLLIAGDVLSASGRMRRKLEKEVGIWDKMPLGTSKDHLDGMIKRHMLELSWHDTRPFRAPLRTVIVLQALLAIGVTIFGLLYQGTHPDTWPFAVHTSTLIVVGVLLALSVGEVIWINFLRRTWVNRRLDLDQLRPKERHLGPTRRARVQVPASNAVSSWRRILQARRNRRARP